MVLLTALLRVMVQPSTTPRSTRLGSRASGGQGSLLKASSSRSAPARSVKSHKGSRASDAHRPGKRYRGTDTEQVPSVRTPATAARSAVVSQASKRVKRAPHKAPATGPRTRAPRRETAKVLLVKPEPLGLPKLPLFLPKAPKDPEPPKPTLWWTCDFPGCGFQVFKKPDVQGHSHYRKVHLQGARELESRHFRISQQMEGYDKGWEITFQSLQKKGWWALSTGRLRTLGGKAVTKGIPTGGRCTSAPSVTAWFPDVK